MKQTFKTILQTPARTIVALVAVFALVMMPVTTASADVFDEQIKALQNEVGQFQAEAARLRAQADTLQNQLNILQSEKNALQREITLNEAKLVQLNDEIIKTEARIDNQKELLGQNLRASYLETSISPVEMLASSNSISDFIDKQEYRNKIQESIKTALKRVRELKEELGKQKAAVEQTLVDQKSRREVLAAKEAEQAQLLISTRGEEAAYQQMSRERNAKITSLRAQQAAANIKWGGNVSYQPRGGGYPSFWADAPLDAYIDNWGMYTRECVSYTAFKVAASGRYMPYWGGQGNANQWDDNARSGWRLPNPIAVDSNPREGDVAVWNVGYYGHVMYVEAVLGNGDILISEYNYDWTGRYSERVISRSTWQAQGLVFIHFP